MKRRNSTAFSREFPHITPLPMADAHFANVLREYEVVEKQVVRIKTGRLPATRAYRKALGKYRDTLRETLGVLLQSHG